MEEIVNWVGVEWRNGSEGCLLPFDPNLLALMKKNVDGIGKLNGKIEINFWGQQRQFRMEMTQKFNLVSN